MQQKDVAMAAGDRVLRYCNSEFQDIMLDIFEVEYAGFEKC